MSDPQADWNCPMCLSKKLMKYGTTCKELDRMNPFTSCPEVTQMSDFNANAWHYIMKAQKKAGNVPVIGLGISEISDGE